MNSETKIQVLGSGCPTCKKFFEATKQVIHDLGIETEVEYVTDIQKIIEMGVMQTPVLAVNGKPVLSGGYEENKIKEVLQTIFAKKDNDVDKRSCGNC